MNGRTRGFCLLGITALAAAVAGGVTFSSRASASAGDFPNETLLRAQLVAAPNTGGDAGGLFHGTRMWGSIVDRSGVVQVTTTSQADPSQVWPGSQAIAQAKAYTANAFSLDSLPLSTAMLYTFTQPGHSLNSLGQSNPFDPQALATPFGQRAGTQKLAGGMIFFGGGVPLYKNGKVVGGLGVSGDTSCCDHEIAKRVRHLMGMDPPGGMTVDDISFSSVDGPSVFTHPLALNTWRNGVFIGNEAPATGY